MINNALAFIIIAASIIGVWGNFGRGTIIAMLGIIGAVLLFVCVNAAQVGDFGPAMGIGAFVVTLGLFYLIRRKGG